MKTRITKRDLAWDIVNALFPEHEGKSQRKKNYVENYLKRSKSYLEALHELAVPVLQKRVASK
jgi:DNA relaxase NicK